MNCPTCGRTGAHFCPGPPAAPSQWTIYPCVHPEHNPPMHLYIQPGQSYTHICPACGYTVVMAPPFIT